MVLLVIAFAPSLAVAAESTNSNYPGYVLVWSDEFHPTSSKSKQLPDPARWNFEQGFIRNNESQYYTSNRLENARVENGLLVIEARREKFPNHAYEAGSKNPRKKESAEYTSASLTTAGKAEWRYGRVDVRARVPKGRGVWPAAWMLGSNFRTVGWPRCGEIDIMEYVGFEPDTIHANIHTVKYNHARGTGKGNKIDLKRPYEQFHVYSVEWTAEKIDFMVDGKIYFTYVKEQGADESVWPFDQPHYLILNLAIGGAWGGQKGVDDSIFPQRYEIDYVRVYQKK
jgi:beta-glucanase (GH16 family)